MNNYSVNYLQEMISIASKAMRNSDYIRPELKESLFDAITQAWLEIVRVIYLMAPALAKDGVPGYEGFSLQLDETFNFDNVSDEERLIAVIAAIPWNIVTWYKDDIYSSKLANLMYSKINKPVNPIIRHLLIGVTITEQPDRWVDVVRKYLADTDRNSYYFGDTLDMLSFKWRFGAMSDQDTGFTKKLLLAGVAKLYSGSNRLELGNARSINPQKALPEREVRDEDDEA